jgi:hypothetical protein
VDEERLKVRQAVLFCKKEPKNFYSFGFALPLATAKPMNESFCFFLQKEALASFSRTSRASVPGQRGCFALCDRQSCDWPLAADMGNTGGAA